MTEEFPPRALLLLADCGVKSMVVLTAAWLFVRLIRRSAAARHLVWQTAFVVLLLLPLLSCLVPSSGAIHVLAVASTTDKGAQTTSAGGSALTSGRVDRAASISPGSPRREEPLGRSKLTSDLLPFLMKGAVVLWLCGAGLVILRLALAHLLIARLRRRSLLGAPRVVDLTSVSGKAGLRRRWELRTSPGAKPSSAVTWGILRPVVLLPRDSAGWSDGWLEAVLLHELAHVRRRDYVSQLLVESVCAFYWWNPLVWAGARATRVEAERAADDLVLDCGVSPSAYAAELLRSAAAPAGGVQRLAGYGLSMTNGSPIEARIRSIVEPHHRRRGTGSTESAAAIAAGLLILLPLVSYRSVGFASHVTDAPPPARGAWTSMDVLQESHSRTDDVQARSDSGTVKGRAGLVRKPVFSPPRRSPAGPPSNKSVRFGADVAAPRRQEDGAAARSADLVEDGINAQNVSEKVGADVLPVSSPYGKKSGADGQARSPDVWRDSP